MGQTFTKHAGHSEEDEGIPWQRSNVRRSRRRPATLHKDKETGRGLSPPRPLLAVPNVTAHPSTASVPTSYYSMYHYNCLWSLKD